LYKSPGNDWQWPGTDGRGLRFGRLIGPANGGAVMLGRFRSVLWIAGLVLALVVHPGGRLAADERIELREETADVRVRSVEVELSVNGKVFPAPGPDKALKLAVEARFEYFERRLPRAGREAESLRGIRHYEQARASIQAGDQISNSSLRNSQRLIVAHGQLAGIDLFSPSGPLTYNELELLRVPGDSLAVLSLLPDSTVELDESWKAPVWALPLVTGLEAVESGELTCRVESIDGNVARVGFRGDVVGAAVGAASGMHVEGHLLFDKEQKLVSQIEVTQTEKRAIGAVSPGLDVAANVHVSRRLAERPVRLTDQNLVELPLEPNTANQLLMLEAPAWNLRIYHDRRWHLFHQSAEAALLRLLDQGGFVAQCNIKKLADAEPGQHVSEEQFQSDIRQTLGKNFQQIVQSEKLRLKDGLYVFRVVAVGSVDRLSEKNEPESSPMQWIYYLVANSDGRQLSFVFSIDPRQTKELENRDLSMVAGVEFLSPCLRPRPAPAPAAKAVKVK
jgi:hypothetical protein